MHITASLLQTSTHTMQNDRFRNRRAKTRLSIGFTPRAQAIIDELFPDAHYPQREDYATEADYDLAFDAYRLVGKANRQAQIALTLPCLRAALESVGIDPATKMTWSRTAGCSGGCGCSPAFILEHTDSLRNLWISAEVDLVCDDPALMDRADTAQYRREVESSLYAYKRQQEKIEQARAALREAEESVAVAEAALA